MIRTYRALVALFCSSCLLSGTAPAATTSDGWKFNPRPVVSRVQEAKSVPAPAPRYDFDFRGLDLRTAIKSLGDRENRRVLVLDSVQAKPMDQWYLRNYTCDDVWFAIHKAFNLNWVTVNGIMYVGTITDLAQRFPSLAGLEEVVLPYSGDPASIDSFTKVLAGDLPDYASVFGDRSNGTIVVVGTPDVISSAHAFMQTVNGASAISSGAFVSRAVPLRGTSATEILPKVRESLGALIPPDTIVDSPDGNALVVSGSPEFVKRAQAVIANFDQPVPMVRMDVAVVALEPNNDNLNFGIQWGGNNAQGQPQPGGGSAVTLFTGRSIAVNAQINALASAGRASILTRGALYARNNRESTINGQTDIAIPVTQGGITQTISLEHFYIGAKIQVTPTITTEGLLMNLDAQYSTLAGATGGALSVPIVQTNESKNSLVLHNDEALVIGGTYTDSDSDTVSKVPYLGDIPLLGGLFKNKQSQHIRQQVVFIVTPHYSTGVDSFNSPAAPIGVPSNLDLSTPIFHGSLLDAPVHGAKP